MLLILLIRIFLREFLTSDCKIVESSDAPFSSVKTSLSDLKFQLPSIKFSEFFANRVLPFLFRCNFFKPSWFSFKFSLSINPIFFCSQKFLSLEFVSARDLFKLFLSFQRDIRGLVFSNNNIRKRYCSVNCFLFSFTDNCFNIIQKIHIVYEVVSNYLNN